MAFIYVVAKGHRKPTAINISRATVGDSPVARMRRIVAPKATIEHCPTVDPTSYRYISDIDVETLPFYLSGSYWFLHLI